MQPESTVSAAWTGVLVKGLEGLGIDVRSACGDAGLDYALLNNSELRVSRADWWQVWRIALDRRPGATLGLDAAAAAPMAADHILALASLSAPSLLDAVRQHAHLQRLLAPTQLLSVRECGDTASFVLARLGGPPELNRHAAEYILAYLFRFWRHFAYPDLRPLRVRFSHPWPHDGTAHEQLFGCPVEFGRRDDALIFASATIARPRATFNESIYAELRRQADAAAAELREESCAARAAAAIRARLQRGAVDVRTIASALGMTARTLQRRLASEGTSFQAVVDGARRQVALTALERGHDLRAAAQTAGFAAEPSFWRAFKRWTGETPAAFMARRGTH